MPLNEMNPANRPLRNGSGNEVYHIWPRTYYQSQTSKSK